MSSLSWKSSRIYFCKKSSDDGSVEIKKGDKRNIGKNALMIVSFSSEKQDITSTLSLDRLDIQTMTFNRIDHHCISWMSLICIVIRDGCSREIVVPVRACRINSDKNLQRKHIQMCISMWKDTRIYVSTRSHIESILIPMISLIVTRRASIWLIEKRTQLNVYRRRFRDKSRRWRFCRTAFKRIWRTWNILTKWTRKDTLRVRLRELQEYCTWRRWWKEEGEWQGQWRRRTTSLLLGR